MGKIIIWLQILNFLFIEKTTIMNLILVQIERY